MSKGHGIILGGKVILTGSSIQRAPGAHRIATFLRKQGYDIEVLDMVYAFTLEELKNFIRERVHSKTRFIGLSGTLIGPNHLTIVPLFNWIKETWPRIHLVAGSQSFYNIHVPPTDYAITGYGELAILELLEKGHLKSTQRTINGCTRNVVEALHNYKAFPLEDLFMEYEDRDYMVPGEMTFFEASRGCIFNCHFCEFPVRGVRGDHTSSADLMHDNLLKNYDKWGLQHYYITDDTFNDYSNKIIKFADAIEKLPFRPYLAGTLRADLLERRDDIEHLSRMNLIWQFYGVESFHRPSAKIVGKGGDPDKIKESLIKVKDYFKQNNGYYRGHISMIIGLPGETMESMMDGIEWIRQNWRGEHVSLNPYIMNVPGGQIETESKIVQDPEKYGYETISYEDMNIDFDEVKWVFGRNHLTDYQKQMMENWKSKWSDTRNLHLNAQAWRNDQGLTFWDMGKLMLTELIADDSFNEQGLTWMEFPDWTGLGYDMDTLHKPIKEVGARPDQNLREEFVQNYKRKKLG